MPLLLLKPGRSLIHLAGGGDLRRQIDTERAAIADKTTGWATLIVVLTHAPIGAIAPSRDPRAVADILAPRAAQGIFMRVPIIDHIDASGFGPNMVADLAEELKLNRIGVGAGDIEGNGAGVGVGGAGCAA
jgi:hypothetical protein